MVWDITKKNEGVQQLRPWFENLIARVQIFYVIVVATKLDLLSNDEINVCVMEMQKAITDLLDTIPAVKSARDRDAFFDKRHQTFFVSLNPKFPDYSKSRFINFNFKWLCLFLFILLFA